MAQLGHSTGILDLTRGEMGTRGSAEERRREAEEAAKILRLSCRRALDIPDGRVENTYENRLKVARVIRELRPRVVILPYWKGRHPDHYAASILGYESCFLAGLNRLDVKSGKPNPRGKRTSAGRSKLETREVRLPAHRPFKIIYATLYYDVRPTFVVDISRQFDARFRALMAYRSQYSDQRAGTGIFPPSSQIRAKMESMARFYGALAGVEYGEPFVQKEIGLVEDLIGIPVASI